MLEYNRMLGSRALIVSFLGSGLLWYLTLYNGTDQKVAKLIVPISLVFSSWALAALWKKDLLKFHRKLPAAIGLIYFGFSMTLAIDLLTNYENFSRWNLLGVIFIIWSGDSFAYLVGSWIGKTKLFPSVSPNKTWEGTIGGGVFALITGFLYFYFKEINSASYWMILGVVIYIFGSLGDLVESSIKRFFNVKDSGNILPGHGGFFDRFDSFIFIWPFVYIIHYFLG